MQAATNPLQQPATTSSFFNPNTFQGPLNLDPNILAGAVVPMQQGQFPNAFPNPYMMGFAQQPQAFSPNFGGMYPASMLHNQPQETKTKVKVVVAAPLKEEEVRTSRELIKDFNGSPDSQEYKERAEFLMWKMRCLGGLVPKSDKNTYEPNLYIALECFAILGGLNNQDYKRFVYDSMIEILGNINGDLKLYSSHAGSLVNICDVLSEHTDISNVQKNNVDVHCKILKTYSLIGMALLRYSKPQNFGKPLISGFSDQFKQKMTALIVDMEKLNVVQDLDLKAESQFARSCFCLLNVDSNVLLEIAGVLDNLCGMAASAKAEDYSGLRANFIELMKKVTEAKPVFWIDIGIAMRTLGYIALTHKDSILWHKDCRPNIDAIIKMVEKEASKDFIFPFLALSMDMLIQLAIEIRYDSESYAAYVGFIRFFGNIKAESGKYNQSLYKVGTKTYTESRWTWLSGKTRFDAYPYMRLKYIERCFDIALRYCNKAPGSLTSYHEKVIRKETRSFLELVQTDGCQVNGQIIGKAVLARLQEIIGNNYDPKKAHIIGYWNTLVNEWVWEYDKFAFKGPDENPYNQPKPAPSAKKDKDTTHKVKVKVKEDTFGAPQRDMADYQYQQQIMYNQLMLQQYQQQMFLYQQAQLGYPAPVAAIPVSPQFNGHVALPQTPPSRNLSSSSSSSTGSLTNSTESSLGNSQNSSSSLSSPVSIFSPSSSESDSDKYESQALAQQISQMTLVPSQSAKPVSYNWLEEEIAKLKNKRPSWRFLDLTKREGFCVNEEVAKFIVNTLQAHEIFKVGAFTFNNKEEYLLVASQLEKTNLHRCTYECYKKVATLESNNSIKAKLYYNAGVFALKAGKRRYAEWAFHDAIKTDHSYDRVASDLLRWTNSIYITIEEAHTLLGIGVTPDFNFLKIFGEATIEKYSNTLLNDRDFAPKKDLVETRFHFLNYINSHSDDVEIRQILTRIDGVIRTLHEKTEDTELEFELPAELRLEQTPKPYAWLEKEIVRLKYIEPTERELYLVNGQERIILTCEFANFLLNTLKTHEIEYISILAQLTNEEKDLLFEKLKWSHIAKVNALIISEDDSFILIQLILISKIQKTPVLPDVKRKLNLIQLINEKIPEAVEKKLIKSVYMKNRSFIINKRDYRNYMRIDITWTINIQNNQGQAEELEIKESLKTWIWLPLNFNESVAKTKAWMLMKRYAAECQNALYSK